MSSVYNLKNTRISDVPQIYWNKWPKVSPTSTLEEVLSVMKKLNANAVIVQSESIEGIFTSNDLPKLITDNPLSVFKLKISEVMTKQPDTISLTDSLSNALLKLYFGGFNHLPVIDEVGKTCGILTVHDLLETIIESLEPHVSESVREELIDFRGKRLKQQIAAWRENEYSAQKPSR